MINEQLDIARWKRLIQQQGRAQVRDFLQEAAAVEIARCLEQDVRWSLAYDEGEGARTVAFKAYSQMDDATRAKLLAQVASNRETAFSYAYDNYDILEAYQAGHDTGLLLHRVLEFFNSDPYLPFVRYLTGDDRINRISAMASRYRPGQFLRLHNDKHSDEGRLFAYVLNLSRQWEADWGGLLQFIAADGSVVDTFIPRWNTLSVFAVPAGHAVSMVTPWARHDRLALAGWFRQ